MPTFNCHSYRRYFRPRFAGFAGITLSLVSLAGAQSIGNSGQSKEAWSTSRERWFQGASRDSKSGERI